MAALTQWNYLLAHVGECRYEYLLGREWLRSPYNVMRLVLCVLRLIWFACTFVVVASMPSDSTVAALGNQTKDGVPLSIVRQLAEHEVRLEENQRYHEHLSALNIEGRLASLEAAALHAAETAEGNRNLLYMILSAIVIMMVTQVLAVLRTVTRPQMRSGK